MGSTLVIGFGNTLRGDDGVGILAVRALRNKGRFDPHVSFLEMEAAMVNLLDHLEGVDKLLVVDSIQTPGGVPGRTRRMTLDELDAAKGEAVSTHQMGLSRVLGLAESLGYTQQRNVTICTLEIAPPAAFSDHPSELVMQKMPEFLDLITAAIFQRNRGEHFHGNDKIRPDRTQMPPAINENR